MHKKKIWCYSRYMKHIFELELMIFSVQLRVTYILNREILSITYWDLFLTLVRCLRVEVISIGYNVICGSCVSEPGFCILCVMQVRSTSHCSKFGGRVFALVSKIHSVIVVNGIVPYFPTYLTCRPFTLALKCSLRSLLCRRANLLFLVLRRILSWGIWRAKALIKAWVSSTSTSAFRVRVPASTSIEALIAIKIRFVMRNKHG